MLMRLSRMAIISILILPLVLMSVPQTSSEGAPSDQALGVYFTPFHDHDPGSLEIYAGGSASIDITLHNSTTGVRYVHYNGDNLRSTSLSSSVDRTLVILKANEDVVVVLTISADRYSGSVRDIVAEFTFEVSFPQNTGNNEFFVFSENIHISTGRASENQFNKIMGLINNPFPAPFDTAVFAAAVTFLIWVAIALIIGKVVFPRVVVPIFFKKKTKDNIEILERRILRPLFLMVLLYGIIMCIAVLGAGEYTISMVTTISIIIFILLGARIAWILFESVLDMYDKYAIENGEDERNSLTPLLLMLGKIIIAMTVVAIILGVMGFSLMIIITGAGIIGLAVSFGAQNTLAQFFAGATLLMTRPFREGDLVRLDNGTDTLRVLHVGLMMTTFRNWANSEIFSMPNQKVASSTIINVTAESLSYRIIVLIRIPYGSDVKKAMKLALEAMEEHPRILMDGTEEMPKARLEDFSNLLLR